MTIHQDPTLQAGPLEFSRALELLEERAASLALKPSTVRSYQSAARDAVREGLRRSGVDSGGSLDSIDVRSILPVLHVLARDASERKGHRRPSDHASRASRFVEILTGSRPGKKRQKVPVGARWSALQKALPRERSEIRFFARCCSVAGARNAPAELPTHAELLEAAESLEGKENGKPRLTRARSAYRRARARVAKSADCEDQVLAPLPPTKNPRLSQLGSGSSAEELLKLIPDSEITERLEASLGSSNQEDILNVDDLLRVLAPEMTEDFDYWSSEGPGALLSEAYRKQCWGSLKRVAGWLVRAGRARDLKELHLDDLFANDIEVSSGSSMNRRLARRRHKETTASISLLLHLVDLVADDALRRSPVVRYSDLGTSPDGKPWITESLRQDCSRIWAMTKGVYGDLSIGSAEDVQRWSLIQSRWEQLKKSLSERSIPVRLKPHTKRKDSLIRTITLPQLVCVGLPERRKELDQLRQNWLAVRESAETKGVPWTPELKRASRAYFDRNAIPHLVLTLLLDDGLREKQYRRGRLGEHFRLTLAGDGASVESLTTWWSGERSDPASLKVAERGNQIARRLDRDVRFGIVPKIVLEDYLFWWRPRALLHAQKIDSVETYDLESDAEEARWALFVSPRRSVKRSDHSRTDLSQMFGRELHRVTRTFVRPTLDDWASVRSDPKWRSLWSAHASRLLIGSYWGGVRSEWDVATYLTQDTEEMLRGAYSEVAHEIKDRLGLDRGHWEHPNAFDQEMDRIYKERQVL